MRSGFVVFFLLAACQRPAAPSPTVVAVKEPVVPSASATPEAAAPGAVATAIDPYGELPLGDDDRDRIAGFSADDKYVGYSISTCDPCPTELHFRGPGVPAIDLHYYYDPRQPEAVQAKQRKIQDDAVNRKLESLGAVKAGAARALRGPFPEDLVFASKVEDDAAHGKKTIFFGARLRTEKDPVFPIHITLGPHPMFDAIPADQKSNMAKMTVAERTKALDEWRAQWEIGDPRIVYANVSKDGKEIAAVAVAGGTMWWETADLVRMKTTDFVAKIRDESAKRHP